MLFDLKISPSQRLSPRYFRISQQTELLTLWLPGHQLFQKISKVLEGLDVYCCCERQSCDLEESTRSPSCRIHASLINGNQESWGQAIAKPAFPQILQFLFFEHVTFKWRGVWMYILCKRSMHCASKQTKSKFHMGRTWAISFQEEEKTNNQFMILFSATKKTHIRCKWRVKLWNWQIGVGHHLTWIT